MIGDNARQVLMEDAVRVKLNARILCSKTGKVPKIGDNPLYNKDFFFTDGLYSLSYRPSKGPNVKKENEYLLRCDLFPGRTLRVGDYKYIKEKAEEGDWRFKFLLEWTTLSSKIFKIAKKNFNLPLPFSLNIEKYHGCLEKQVTGTGTGLLMEHEMIEAELRRINHIQEVAWELPVKIEV